MYFNRRMSTASETELQLCGDGLILTNLKSAAFKMSVEPTSGTVIGIMSCGDLLFISLLHQGLNIYRQATLLNYIVCIRLHLIMHQNNGLSRPIDEQTRVGVRGLV